MHEDGELLIKCLELTKNEAFTKNTDMWCEAAYALYNSIKSKKEKLITDLGKETVKFERITLTESTSKP